MSMSDPIADMLARIRNAVMAKHESLVMPTSKIKAEIAALLRQDGYIRGFRIVRGEHQGELHIALKYHNGAPAIRGIKRVSRPGLRVYTGATELPKVLNGLGSAVLSTNKGIMSDQEAREHKVGGEVLLHIW